MPRLQPYLLTESLRDPAPHDTDLNRRFASPGRVPLGGVQGQPDHRDEPRKGDRDGGDRPPPYRPKLLCRTHLDDVGSRPLAPGLMFWESPDIWVTAPDGSDVPMAGQVNQVHVHVWNVGAAPCYGATVELYWCNPSVGVNLADATLIGMATATLQAGDHTVLDFPWTPTFVNGGHECLVAHAYDPVSDPLVAPFNPVLDCHAAQHNINVVTAQQGQPLRLDFLVTNFSARSVRSSLQVMELRGAELRGAGQVMGRDALAPVRGAGAALIQGKIGPVNPTLDMREHPVAATFRQTLQAAPSCFRAGLLRGALDTLMAPAKGQRPGTDHPSETDQPRLTGQNRPEDGEVTTSRPALLPGQIHLEPFTQATVTLSVQPPPHAPGGSTFAYRVVETVDGVVTGGLTYLVQIGEKGRERPRNRRSSSV